MYQKYSSFGIAVLQKILNWSDLFFSICAVRPLLSLNNRGLYRIIQYKPRIDANSSVVPA
jgi:hypothetical protein